MADTARITYQGKTYELPVVEGTFGEKAIDIGNLRKETGLITFDPGFMSTGSCKSSITFLDGENGILLYRGIPIDQLAEKSTFIETSYLLIYGILPNSKQLADFNHHITHHSMVHESIKRFYDGFPINSHPMAVRPRLLAATRVVPEPANGSAITPGGEYEISCSISPIGFGVGWLGRSCDPPGRVGALYTLLRRGPVHPSPMT